MNILKKFLTIDLFILAVNLPFVTANAQQNEDFTPPVRPFWQYSAKFLCGSSANDVELVKGVYTTAINIHNTSPYQQVQFRIKAVVVYSESLKNSEGTVLVSPYQGESLVSDDAMGVNCNDIRALFPAQQPPANFEGFLVIQVLGRLVPATPDPLDVVANYSARADTFGVTTLNVVQIPAKFFP